MSETPKSIKKNRTFPPSMNYALLKKEGIEHSQQLSGDIWTDYNEHDPGITILENVCYALTELGYKTNFKIEDLLYAKSDEDEPINNVLYNIVEIFPCAPLTALDYRRMIIDRIPEVNNAWILPLQQSGLGININGLYEVLLQVRSQVKDKKAVEEKVRKLLSRYRNLCEDFDNVRALKSEKIVIRANISIESNIVGESILAKILFELSEWLSPQLSFYNLEEMLEKGYSYDEIFDGPPPLNGFIDKEDLKRSDIQHINTLYKSRLIQLISDIPGVIAVTNFVVEINGKEVEKELIELEKYTYPTLDIDTILAREGTIQFYAGDIVYGVDRATTQYSFDMLQAKSRRSHRRWLDLNMENGSSVKTSEEIEYFYSIQNTFPSVYRIGQFGMEVRSSDERKGQANQLKAYLLFYEQLMINYLSQLTNIRRLFSVEDNLDQTYFYNGLDTIPDGDLLLKGGKEKFEKELGNLVQKYDKHIERRNRFLDHLLARFGEEFMDDAYNAIHREANFYTKEDFGKKSIKTKLKFLKNYIDISRNRAKGYDYYGDLDDPENVPGLKKKICLLFNIEDYGHRSLSNVSKDKSLKTAIGKAKDEPKLKKSEFTFKSDKKDILSEVLAHGISRNNYIIELEKPNFNIYFIHPINNDKTKVYQGKSLLECEDALKKLIERLRQLNKEADGFHVIEHILLRPINSTYTLFLSSPLSRLLQSAKNFSDPEQGKIDFAKQLLEFGLDKKNYKVDKKENGNFELQLRDKDKNLIAFNDEFILKKSATDAIGDVRQLINHYTRKPLALPNDLDADLQSKAGAAFIKDPYSQKMSFVLPSWAGRFQSKKMKALFENVVRINTPAHLATFFHWLTIEEMTHFENKYQEWLKEKAKGEKTSIDLDDLSLVLLNMLLKNND